MSDAPFVHDAVFARYPKGTDVRAALREAMGVFMERTDGTNALEGPEPMNCLLCSEPMETTTEHTQQAHRECLLRSALGGIGHHEDHAHWCVEMGDPDGGRSFRESAREVMALLAVIGPDQLARQAAVPPPSD
jgi:hypothetical protein